MEDEYGPVEHVPVELARLWRLSPESRRGRPARLDVGTVVDTAVDLADREGLGAVTLPRVAQALEVTKMSLYRHVGSKDELISLMQDAGTGTVPPSLDGTGPWRERLRLWALEQREILRGRPWLLAVPLSAPPGGPNMLQWFDAGLRSMRESGLGWGSKVGVCMLVSDYVRGSTRIVHELEAGRSGSGLEQEAVEREFGRAMARLVQPERFPDAAALFASPTFADTGPDTGEKDFRFGLELILDGVAAAVERENGRS